MKMINMLKADEGRKRLRLGVRGELEKKDEICDLYLAVYQIYLGHSLARSIKDTSICFTSWSGGMEIFQSQDTKEVAPK